ncbi:hypothetical protein KDL44_10265 [bacterium]|nr:hypothetical protein [bacterium]
MEGTPEARGFKMFGFYYGTRLFGRSPAFWPFVLLGFVMLFSSYDQGQGLRSIFLGTWYGIPVILIILTMAGLVFWLGHKLELSGRSELSEEIERNEAAFVAGNRPGGWKEYYGIEDAGADDAQIVPDSVARTGWKPSFGEAGDRLAEVAERHRSEQRRLRRDADNLHWLRSRSDN